MDILDTMFQWFVENPQGSKNYSFPSHDNLTNEHAMQHFLTTNQLTHHVVKDLGSMVFLAHPQYDFYVVIETHNDGYAYTHGVTAFRTENV